MTTLDFRRKRKFILLYISSIPIDADILQVIILFKNDVHGLLVCIDLDRLRPFRVKRQDVGNDNRVGDVILQAGYCK